MGLQYKQYTTIKITHLSKINLTHLILWYLTGETRLLHSELYFCSPSFCSALSPKEGFGREADFMNRRSYPVTISCRGDGPISPKGPLPGARQHCAEALYFCSSSPMAACIREDLPQRQLVALWKGKKVLNPNCLLHIVTGEDHITSAGQPKHSCPCSHSCKQPLGC